MQELTVSESLKILSISFLLSIFSMTIAYSRGFFHLETLKWKSHVSLRDLFGAFFIFTGVQLILAPLSAVVGIQLFFGKIAGQMTGGWIQGWFVVYSMFFSCLALFFYTAKLTDASTYQSIWPAAKKKDQSFFLGVSVLLVAYPFVITVGQSIRLLMSMVFSIKQTDQAAVSTLKISMDYPFMHSIMIFAVICLVPIAEELLFRGYLQGWMRRHLNPKGAIMITSLVFSGFHFSTQQSWSNIELLISLFLLSLFLGVLYEKKRTLWAPIGLHTSFNALNVVLLYWFFHSA